MIQKQHLKIMTLNNTITKLREYIIGKHTPPYCCRAAVSCSLEIEASCSCPIGNSPAVGTGGGLIGSNNLMHYQLIFILKKLSSPYQ